MIVRFGLLQKKSGMTQEEFSRFWLTKHGPLARRMPGLRAYSQNHIVDTRQLGIAHQRGAWQFDGFSQLWFDDAEQMRRGITSDLGPELVRDEKLFIGNLHIIVAEPHTVIEPPARPHKVLKRMSLLTRLPGMTDDKYRHEWLNVHDGLVRKIPGVRGYRQNLVVARERVKGVPCSSSELPIDGMVELWFDSVPSIEAAFASPAGQDALAHGRTFLSEVTTFLVEEHVIV